MLSGSVLESRGWLSEYGGNNNNNNNNATALSPHDEIKSSNPSLLALIYLKGISERYKANESEKQAT
jgi:hypothetical protein